METKRLGNLGELKALAKFAEYGIPVFIPYGEAEKVDFLADFNGRIHRMQVKSTATMESGKMIFSLRTTAVNTNINKYHHYTSDEIDYLVLYGKFTDEVYIISINDAPTTALNLRIEPPANNSTVNIRMAKDYTLDKFLQNLGYNKD